jgi:hypothetical protein
MIDEISKSLCDSISLVGIFSSVNKVIVFLKFDVIRLESIL